MIYLAGYLAAVFCLFVGKALIEDMAMERKKRATEPPPPPRPALEPWEDWP